MIRPSFTEKIRDAVKDWNHKHPVDHAYRSVHGIAFGSEEHMEMDFIQQHIWYLENEEELKRISRGMKSTGGNSSVNEVKKTEQNKITYTDSYGNEIVYNDGDDGSIPMSQTEIDEEFDKLDIHEVYEDSNFKKIWKIIKL